MIAPKANPQITSRLTDVQLIHHLNSAMCARDKNAAGADSRHPSRLLRIALLRHPVWYALVAVGAQARISLKGAWLAIMLASPERLAAWARGGDEQMRSVMDDIAIMHLLDETERRVKTRRRCESWSGSAMQQERSGW
jgi:hypothetical protein